MRTWHFRFALLTCDHQHLPLASTTRLPPRSPLCCTPHHSELDGHLDGERSGSRSGRITTAAGTCVVLLAHGRTTASPLRRGDIIGTLHMLMRPQRRRRCFVLFLHPTRDANAHHVDLEAPWAARPQRRCEKDDFNSSGEGPPRSRTMYHDTAQAACFDGASSKGQVYGRRGTEDHYGMYWSNYVQDTRIRLSANRQHDGVQRDFARTDVTSHP